MKMTYKEYNQLFDVIMSNILNKKPLPKNNCKQWRDYAIVAQDVCNELKIPYQYMGSVKSSFLNNQPVFMGNDIDKFPMETKWIINDFQEQFFKKCSNNWTAMFTSIHSDQCEYLVIAY